MDALFNSLTATELALVRSTAPAALVDLDEDALLDLHGRVRRARNKYLGQYRRQASARVRGAGGRGQAYAENQRARDKVEVFETSLARVSSAVAKAARRSAAELKSERLAAARSAGGAAARLPGSQPRPRRTPRPIVGRRGSPPDVRSAMPRTSRSDGAIRRAATTADGTAIRTRGSVCGSRRRSGWSDADRLIRMNSFSSGASRPVRSLVRLRERPLENG